MEFLEALEEALKLSQRVYLRFSLLTVGWRVLCPTLVYRGVASQSYCCVNDLVGETEDCWEDSMAHAFCAACIADYTVTKKIFKAK